MHTEIGRVALRLGGVEEANGAFSPHMQLDAVGSGGTKRMSTRRASTESPSYAALHLPLSFETNADKSSLIMVTELNGL